MTNSQRLSAVRQKLHAWFLDQQSGDAWEVRESILIREGFYCGRRFDFAAYRAVWFVEEDQVKVYGRDGALVGSFQPSACTQLRAVAAPQDEAAAAAAADHQPPVRRAA